MIKASKKILIICGPTATGKTSLGLNLARQFNGQIISADSRQVYKHMDIGTGKDVPEKIKPQTSNLKVDNQSLSFYQINGIKLWGYDLVKPNQEFSLAHFYQFASLVISQIWRQNKLPIIVGGTGLYVRSLTQSLTTINIPPNYPLRRQLQNLSLRSLQKKLKLLDHHKFHQLNQSDKNNPRRLIRAIEITIYSKNRSSVKINRNSLPIDNILLVGLKAPLPVIDRQIEIRVKDRIKKGMIKEVRSLINQYKKWNLPAFSACGYSQIKDYLDHKLTKSAAIKNWITAEKQYARRQLTWFKANPHIHWFDITSNTYPQTIVRLVKHWYTQITPHARQTHKN